MSSRLLGIVTTVVVLALAAPALAGEGSGSIADQRRAWEASALALTVDYQRGDSYDLVPAASANFCDKEHPPGTSKSCKRSANIVCPGGAAPRNVTCNVKRDASCASGYWCECSWDC